MKAGIVGYGAYVPRHYIKSKEIDTRAGGLGLEKKALAGWDEDAVTMAAEAGHIALRVAEVNPKQIGAVYFGSESPPYAVNPSSTIVADVLGIEQEYRAVDLQFACKAATAGLQMAAGQVESKHMDFGLVIGSDKSQARPGDALEWSAGAAAAALVIGKNKPVAKILGGVSVSSDTPDFWRRSEQKYPRHGGRFTGEPGYVKHVVEASRKVMKVTGLAAIDFDHVIFHMPNGKFPFLAAKQLEIKPERLSASLTVTEVGNPYAASALLGLVSVLEVAKPGELVLMTAYGSGAGADSLVLEITKEIETKRWGGLASLFEERVLVLKEEYLKRERWE